MYRDILVASFVDTLVDLVVQCAFPGFAFEALGGVDDAAECRRLPPCSVVFVSVYCFKRSISRARSLRWT